MGCLIPLLIYNHCLLVGQWWCVMLKLVTKRYSKPTNLFSLSGRNCSMSTVIIPLNDLSLNCARYWCLKSLFFLSTPLLVWMTLLVVHLGKHKPITIIKQCEFKREKNVLFQNMWSNNSLYHQKNNNDYSRQLKNSHWCFSLTTYKLVWNWTCSFGEPMHSPIILQIFVYFSPKLARGKINPNSRGWSRK